MQEIMLTERFVKITETLTKDIRVQANNNDEAIETVKRLYYGQKIILDSSDFIDVDFSASDEEQVSGLEKEAILDAENKQPMEI